MKKIISAILAICMVAALLAGCGGKNEAIQTAEVTLPVPTDAETAVHTTTALALDYYMAGRAYLDKFLNFDTAALNEQNLGEYQDLLTNAVEAFENVDALSDVLDEALDVWDDEAETGKKPAYKMLASPITFSLGVTAYAAEERGSKKWAQDLVDAYDKAPAGRGIRTLASQLDTDAKHAYAQLKQALAILEGAEYTEIAEQANTAVKTASVLKTAGTAAGLVIAVATAPASGALATAVSTGGITVSGINTVLEIGSTGSILYTNGEDNEFSMACDKTEAQLAPIGQVFAVAGLASSLKDVGKTGMDAWKNGYSSLDDKTKTDLAINTFGILSYGATSLNDYVNDGSILSGTFKATDDGVKFTLKDTLTGTEPEQQKNVKEVLTSSGIDEKKVEEALTAAKEQPEEPVTFQTDSIPDAVADAILEQNTVAAEDDFDIDAYLENLREVLYEIAAMEHEAEATPDEPEGDTQSEEPESEDSQPAGSDAALDALMGTWHYSETYEELDYTLYVTWTMSRSGDGISVHMSMTDEDGTESESFQCGYGFNGEILTLTHEDFEGGMVTFELVNGNLKGTSGEGDTVTMRR